MDFLNKAFAQASDLFRSMTPGARITAGLLLAVVVISLGYLFQHQSLGPDVSLMHGESVPASCLPAMEAAFDKAHLTSYTVEGDRIQVPQGQQAAYMAALVDGKALPPNFGSALDGALDSGNVFESPKQRDLRVKTALQEELSLILGSMKDVEKAYVLYDSQQQTGLSGDKLVTASVSIKPLGTEQLDESRVSAIQSLVCGAIAGLKPECVQVCDLNSGRVFHGESGHGDGENQYMALKQKHERALRAKILSALAYIPGLTVECAVELDKERATRTVSVKVDPKTVPLRTTEQTKTLSREGASGGGGRPGFGTNVNAPSSLAGSGAAGKGSHEEEENSNSTADNESVLRQQTETENVGLTPRRATVAVGIPSSYFEKVWRERNPAKDGETPKTPEPAALDAIREDVITQERKHVATLLPLLPPEAAPNATDLVTITTFQPIEPGPMPVPSVLQNVLAWLGEHWSTLGLAGLVLVGLMMLRSMVRGVGAPEPTAMALRVAATPESAPEEKEPAEVVTARRLRKLAAGGPSLRDELSDLVKEDPDAAANILRTWIGQAG